MAKKPTKEALQKENTELKAQIATLSYNDRDMRQQLTALLHAYVHPNHFGGAREAMTWTEIAFHMGELRADADIHCLIQGRDMFRDEAEQLRRKVRELEGGTN